jgi:hypothetical protein
MVFYVIGAFNTETDFGPWKLSAVLSNQPPPSASLNWAMLVQCSPLPLQIGPRPQSAATTKLHVQGSWRPPNPRTRASLVENLRRTYPCTTADGACERNWVIGPSPISTACAGLGPGAGWGR